MARTTELVNLTPSEQDALTTLAIRLLRADPASAPGAMSHVTLLWFDWRDRWQDHVPSPIPMDPVPHTAPSGVASMERVALDDVEPGSAIDAALTILSSSPHRLVVCEFLLELARSNGVSDRERQFLAFVGQRLTGAVRTGPYR